MIETLFGGVLLVRQRQHCRPCGRHCQRDDALLTPVLGAGRCTPRLRELAALCGASWPYQQAAVVLGQVRGAPLAAETVRRIVAVTGAAVAAQYAAEAQAVCRPPANVPLPRAASPAVEIILDGAWNRSRDNAQGMEVKVGVVHTGSEACGATLGDGAASGALWAVGDWGRRSSLTRRRYWIAGIDAMRAVERRGQRCPTRSSAIRGIAK